MALDPNKTNDKNKEVDKNVDDLDVTKTNETDLLKLSTEDLINKVIKPLRREAANKRVKNKELEEEIASKKEELESTGKTLEEKETILNELKKLKTEQDDKDATELEKVTNRLNTLEESVKEKDKLIEEKDVSLKSATDTISKNEVISVANDLLRKANYQFKNDFEKNGFLSVITGKKDAGKYKSVEEIQEVVEQFLEDNVTAPDAPPSGPSGGNKKTNLDLADEMRILINKPPNLITKEDIQRMKELEREVENNIKPKQRKVWRR